MMEPAMKTFLSCIAACALLLAQTPAHGQLFRAYLSVTGNDANACTIAAPCRLLPAAVNAVADGGEIWILDTANYNTATVNVAKSVSILAVPGEVGSLVSLGAGPALTISAASARLTLRDIVVTDNATNHGTNGIEVSNGATLTLDRCLVANMQAFGVKVSGFSSAEVRDSVFRGNSTAISAQSGGRIDISRSDFLGNGTGIFAETHDTSTTRITVADSVASGHAGSAIWAFTWVAGGVASIQVTRSTIDHNGIGVEASDAAAAHGSSVTLSGNVVVANGSGYYIVTGNAINSFGNNLVADSFGGDVGTLTPAALR
jgi:hypothetical protein